MPTYETACQARLPTAETFCISRFSVELEDWKVIAVELVGKGPFQRIILGGLRSHFLEKKSLYHSKHAIFLG